MENVVNKHISLPRPCPSCLKETYVSVGVAPPKTEFAVRPAGGIRVHLSRRDGTLGDMPANANVE